MYEVKVKGFKTKDAAEEFMNWYSGQGEQDIDVWMECRSEEGRDVQQRFIAVKLDHANLEMFLD